MMHTFTCRFLVRSVLIFGTALGGCASSPSPVGGAYAENHAPAGTPTNIRFLTRHDLPLAGAQINGLDVGFFLIDTGSSATIVERRIAEKLRLPVIRQQTINGIGGSVEATVVRIDALAVGGRTWGSKEAGVVDMSAFNQSVGWPVAGILGLDSLADQIFTLDLQSGTLTLADRATFAPPTGVAVQRLDISGGLPAVHGRIEGHDAIFQIDSGSNDSLSIWIGQFTGHPELLAGKANFQGQSSGVGGHASTVRSQLTSLMVFSRELRDVAFHVEMSDPKNAPAAADGPIIGRLGNDLLKKFRLTFDLANHRLWAVPR